MILLLRLGLLPVRLALGLTGFGFKAGYRTGRLVGYGRVFWIAAGVGIGLLIAPGPGRDLREKLKARIDDYTGAGGVGGGGGGDDELADRVRFELTHSPKTWHLQQPQVSVVAGRVTLRGEVDAEEGRGALEQAAAAVPGVQGVDNQVTVTARAGAS